MKTRLKQEGDAVFLLYPDYNGGEEITVEKLLTANKKEDGEIFLDEHGFPCYALKPLKKEFKIVPLGESLMTIIDSWKFKIDLFKEASRVNRNLADYILFDLIKDLTSILEIRTIDSKPINGGDCIKCGAPRFGAPENSCNC